MHTFDDPQFNFQVFNPRIMKIYLFKGIVKSIYNNYLPNSQKQSKSVA